VFRPRRPLGHLSTAGARLTSPARCAASSAGTGRFLLPGRAGATGSIDVAKFSPHRVGRPSGLRSAVGSHGHRNGCSPGWDPAVRPAVACGADRAAPEPDPLSALVSSATGPGRAADRARRQRGAPLPRPAGGSGGSSAQIAAPVLEESSKGREAGESSVRSPPIPNWKRTSSRNGEEPGHPSARLAQRRGDPPRCCP